MVSALPSFTKKSLDQTRVDTDVLTLARRRIARTFDLFDRASVSFSGGKDSSVLLNLVLEEARRRGQLPLDVFFFDEEAIDPDTIDYVHRVAAWPDVALRWLCLPVTHRNGCSTASPVWYPWAPEDRDLWCRPLPAGAITDLPGFARQSIPEAQACVFPPDGRTVACFVGLRADESLRRRRVMLNRREDNWLHHDPHAPGVTRSYPIYDWRTIDVWTAPQQFGWDYNRAYDKMAMAGISPHQQRITPPYGEQPMQALWKFQVCWPELWDKMAERVPGAATAARYARTELYGFGKFGLEPPQGMSYQDAIAYYLDRHPPQARAFIARRIQKDIANHNQEARGRAIPDHEPDPLTGISWSYLLFIAITGDFKGRHSRRDHLDRSVYSTQKR